MEKNRSTKSLYNALSAIGLSIINGIFGIIVTRLVIEHFGSDFNGLNSTANQIVNVLLVLEAGFTLASNVALFSPLTNHDYGLVNSILNATRKKFRKIGVIFLALGLMVAVGYAFIVNSALPVEFIASIIIMTVVPQAINLFFATTYRVLLQAQQKEYVISFMTMITVGLGHISNITAITLGAPMWIVRFITMAYALLNSCLIILYFKKNNTFLNPNVEPREDLIKGTKDVLIQKITSVVYNAAPIVFLSISKEGGTMLASVYAVYNSVFLMIKSLLNGVIDAPRLGIGQMLTERKRDDVWPVFKQYEYMAFLAIFTLLTTTCTLILPFIRIYTRGVEDINYYDVAIALFMVFISIIELLHMPSGHLINMMGEFKISRNFQTIACTVLLVTMFAGGSIWGIYGMLGALLLTAILLAFLEMGYVHQMFFGKKTIELLKMILPLALAGFVVCYIEIKLPAPITGYFSFFIFGVIFVLVNGLVALLIGYIFNRNELFALINRCKRIIIRK